jgi:transposase
MVQGREKTMLEKREIISRLRRGVSIRRIAKEGGVHRTIVRSLYRLAAENGWLSPNTPMPAECDLVKATVSGSESLPIGSIDEYFDDIKTWRSEGISAVVIQRMLKQKHSFSCEISTLRRHIRRMFPKLPDPVMIRPTVPGEIMDVDFGFLGKLWDNSCNKFRKAWVFSGRLRHSRKAYRELVWRQDTTTFLECHIHAFEYFSGVPEKVVLDNLKAGVLKSIIDNDMLNRSYVECAEHYGFMISPCLPRTPQHKGGVENDMHYIKRNFWPELREKMKSIPKITLKEAQVELEKWAVNIANARMLRGINRSPEEIFQDEEIIALKSLPTSRFEISEWTQCLVGKDWSIVVNGSRYSVPYSLIEKTVQVRTTLRIVKIFFNYEEVASHSRATEKGCYARNPLHAPPFKEEVLFCNRQGLLTQAKDLGENILVFCVKMLSSPYIDKLRPVRCLLRLALRYGKNRLDKACARALSYDTCLYRSVKDILEKGLEEELKENQSDLCPQQCFKHARNPLEYRSINNSSRSKVYVADFKEELIKQEENFE